MAFMYVFGVLFGLAVCTRSWTVLAPQEFEFYLPEHAGRVPAVRYSHTAVYAPSLDAMVVTHGYFFDHRLHHATWLADTWGFMFANSSWTRLHTGEGGPSARYGHTAVLHGNSMLVFGGDGPVAGSVRAMDIIFLCFEACRC